MVEIKTAANEHIAIIAALPSFENICYFCTLFARWKVQRKPQLRQYAGRYLQAVDSAAGQ